MVPKPFFENDGTPIRNIQPLQHRLSITNLPAISGDISKQTAEATLEHLLSTAGIGPNDQPVFFESHKIGYPTGLSDPPQSRYKALHTDYFEIVGPENDIRFTTKIHDFLNANPYPFDAQRHSGKDGFEVIERAPEDLLRKAVKAHIDKHFEDMLDVPAESCISITTESNARHDQCKVLVAVRLAGSTMVDKITASKARSTFSARLNIPIRSMSRLAPQANNKMEPLLVEHTITGVFKRLVKTRGMQEPYAIVVLWAKSNSDPQSVATYTMKCLAEAEKRHEQDYPQEPITRPEGAIVTTDYEPATGTGQHQKAVFRFSISTSAFSRRTWSKWFPHCPLLIDTRLAGTMETNA
ncbi:hypothetical protein MVLG_00803 [Microbotryum lychnidis-dioicae p1A1 Lamole]|uniref:Uncharacterized protein n=1 Tax=Microbotryum lychnidis-dioicae (strain p1A1 Lamole / MvSl-1064) TaxID=683840 RepID=U5H064_USTV1|nr:hypothetical protein MVLG_00803 [Microbotryum lychnidis-dioicae p1A1 Lamole]|eukprot:KDE09086.1 hypothetical protein MVLG_00803 [Microbotryum lychnidis-dioicae p1A1 Lamole]